MFYPGLLERLDTFYELACGTQPRCYRGMAKMLNIEANGVDMLKGLETLFSNVSSSTQHLKSDAYGNAYLALAMLSDKAGQWAQARGYMWRALRYNLRLLGQRGVARRLLKLCIGKKLVRTINSCIRGQIL
jgi:hypothetical protein